MNVTLPCGSIMQIDAEDYARFGSFGWSRRGSEKSGWYVRGKVNGRTESLHRMIMAPGSGQVVDHINGDTLDNRRCNLRVCSQADNLKNQRSKRDVKGVSWCPRRGRWRVTITSNGVKRELKSFETKTEAAVVYDHAAKRLHGDFASLNFSPDRDWLFPYPIADAEGRI